MKTSWLAGFYRYYRDQAGRRRHRRGDDGVAGDGRGMEPTRHTAGNGGGGVVGATPSFC